MAKQPVQNNQIGDFYVTNQGGDSIVDANPSGIYPGSPDTIGLQIQKTNATSALSALKLITAASGAALLIINSGPSADLNAGNGSFIVANDGELQSSNIQINHSSASLILNSPLDSVSVSLILDPTSSILTITSSELNFNSIFDHNVQVSGSFQATTMIASSLSLTGALLASSASFSNNVTINGKLTVDGLIDPTGLILTSQSSLPYNPSSSEGILWVSGAKLKFTNSSGNSLDFLYESTLTAQGDLLYFDGSSQQRLGIGSAGEYLKVSSGLPAWGSLNTSDLSGIVSISNGGLGINSTPGVGQILIGTGSGYALNNLTAGTGISITSSVGSVTISLEDAIPGIFEARISSTTSAVTVSGSSSSTLYLHPYKGNRITTYNGSKWEYLEITSSISTSVTSLSVDTNYDVFVHNNSGTPTVTFVAWSGSLTRSIALSLVDGVYVHGSDNTKRYVGTIRTISDSGTKVVESSTKRFVWNHYNRVKLLLFDHDTGAFNTLSTVSPPWNPIVGNGASKWKHEIVIGLKEDIVESKATLGVSNANGSNIEFALGIGFDIDSTPSQGYALAEVLASSGDNNYQAFYLNYAVPGYHYLQCLSRNVSGSSLSHGARTGSFYTIILG